MEKECHASCSQQVTSPYTILKVIAFDPELENACCHPYFADHIQTATTISLISSAWVNQLSSTGPGLQCRIQHGYNDL